MVFLALGTAQPNIAAALIVGQSFSDPNVVVMVVVVAIVSLLVLMPLSRSLGKRDERPSHADGSTSAFRTGERSG